MKLLYLLFLVSLQAQGEIYKCTMTSGEIHFQDIPCMNSSESYSPPPVMTPLKTIKEPKFISSTHNKSHDKKKSKVCPHFTTTELRNLKVKDKFKKGLSVEHIFNRLGTPNSKESSGKNEKWKYKSDHVWREFKFKNTCLISWKVNWRHGKSQIGKYQQ